MKKHEAICLVMLTILLAVLIAGCDDIKDPEPRSSVITMTVGPEEGCTVEGFDD